MHAAFDFIFLEACLFKNLRIRQEIHFCSSLTGLSCFREQPAHESDDWNAALVAVVMHIAVPADLHIQIGGKCVHDRRADAVQPSACPVRRIVKFAAGVQRCIDDPRSRNSFGMHPDGNSPSVIRHCTGTVRLQRDADRVADPGKMFIDRVVHNFIDQMI